MYTVHYITHDIQHTIYDTRYIIYSVLRAKCFKLINSRVYSCIVTCSINFNIFVLYHRMILIHEKYNLFIVIFIGNV